MLSSACDGRRPIILGAGSPPSSLAWMSLWTPNRRPGGPGSTQGRLFTLSMSSGAGSKEELIMEDIYPCCAAPWRWSFSCKLTGPRYRENVLSTDGKFRRAHRSVVLGQFSTAREVRRAAEIQMRKVSSGNLSACVDMTLTQFWELHFDPDILPMLKPNTGRLYTLMFKRHIEPSLGHLMLHAVGREHIRRLVAAKQQMKYSPQTLGHIRSTLGEIFSVAQQWG